MQDYKLASILALGLASTAAYANPLHGGSQIQWGACDPSVVTDTSLSCGFLNVPLDYHSPSIGVARLALIKANATGERLGSVLFNPGGPGVSGIASVNGDKDLLLEVTGGAYDVVSWVLEVPGDIFCFDSLEEYTTFFNGTIQLTGIEETGNFGDPIDVQALLAQAPTMQQKYEEVGQKCMRSSSGTFLKYIGTAAAVRDMVSIADVLDGPDTPINYIGASYGTILGAWFINMFPERVGRVILDGVVDPVAFATEEPGKTLSSRLVSTDTIYKALITGCALAGPSGCAAASEGDDPLAIDAKVQALLKTAYDATRANASVPITSGEIRAQLFEEMYTPAEWASFMNEVYPQVVQIVNGEGPADASEGLSRRFKDRGHRIPMVKRAAQSNDSPSYTGAAILCADSVDLRGTTMEDVFERIIATSRNVSHVVGSVWPVFDYQCSFWPVRAVERYQGPFNKKLANKILVASNILDPITPFQSAERLASLLGQDAVLVQQRGFGHTTFPEPSACMNDIFSAYMKDGTLPTSGSVCEVDADFELFSGVNTEDILAHLPSTVADG